MADEGISITHDQGLSSFGATHADYFHGRVPVTDAMSSEAIAGDYEKNMGTAIFQAFDDLDYEKVPGVLVANHGPFIWGRDANAAACNAVILEHLARVDYRTIAISHNAPEVPDDLRGKHFFRKHGAKAYYAREEIVAYKGCNHEYWHENDDGNHRRQSRALPRSVSKGRPRRYDPGRAAGWHGCGSP